VIVDTSDNKIDENKQQRQQGANEFSMNKQSQLYANIDNSVKIEDTSTTYSESRYEHHLKQLQDMGFVDRELNLRALQETGGSVVLAVQWLLSPQGKRN
jgi:hypothetical protein